MKHLTLTAAVLCGMVLPAYAQTFTPYIGIDLQRSMIDYNNEIDAGGGDIIDADALLADKMNGFNIHVGNRFSKYFGAELGVFRTQEKKKNLATGTAIGSNAGIPIVTVAPVTNKIKSHGVTLDALGYLPMTDDGRVELIGTAGAS